MADAETLETLAGTMPDGKVAERLGVDLRAVKTFRKEHDVPAYLRPPPEAEPTPSGAETRRRAVVRRRGNEQVEPVAYREPPAPEPVPAPPVVAKPPRRPAGRPPGRPSASARLDAVRDQLGKVSDDVIAAQAGVSRGVVGAYRRKHGIAAYAGYLFQTGHAPLTGERAPAVEKAPAAGRTSRIDEVAAFVGVESDAAVAARVGVSRTAVTAWRRRHGITAMQPRGAPRTQPAAAPRATVPQATVPQAAVPQAAVPRTAVPRAAVQPAVPPAVQPAVGVEPARPAVSLRAYTVRATAKGVQREFVAVGRDMGDACGRAQAGLEARRDGPWLVDTVKLLGDAFA